MVAWRVEGISAHPRRRSYWDNDGRATDKRGRPVQPTDRKKHTKTRGPKEEKGKHRASTGLLALGPACAARCALSTENEKERLPPAFPAGTADTERFWRLARASAARKNVDS